MTAKFPYEVHFGYMERNVTSFNVFAEALAYARNLRDIYESDRARYRNLSVSIYNIDRADQDSYGLTEEEKEAWES